MYNFIAPFIQYGFVKGTGAQDHGVTIAFIATQALNCRQECHIVSLDIKGAFGGMGCYGVFICFLNIRDGLLWSIYLLP